VTIAGPRQRDVMKVEDMSVRGTLTGMEANKKVQHISFRGWEMSPKHDKPPNPGGLRGLIMTPTMAWQDAGVTESRSYQGSFHTAVTGGVLSGSRR